MHTRSLFQNGDRSLQTGNTAWLQTANGSFAEHLCKFWALVRWHEGYVARQAPLLHGLSDVGV